MSKDNSQITKDKRQKSNIQMSSNKCEEDFLQYKTYLDEIRYALVCERQFQVKRISTKCESTAATSNFASQKNKTSMFIMMKLFQEAL